MPAERRNTCERGTPVRAVSPPVRRLVAVLWCMLAPACSTDETSDSAQRTARLVLRNRLDATGAPPLTTVRGLAATSRHVFVGQQYEQQLLMFTTEGQFVTTIGRAGGGPGEFRELMRFGVLADTLWTTDWGLRRLTFFSDTGRLLGTLAFEPDDPENGARELLYLWLPEAPTADGHLLGYGSFNDARALADGRITRAPLLRSTRSGGAIDTLGWYSIEHWAMILRSERSGLYAVQPVKTDNFAIYDGPGGKVCTVERDFRPVRAQTAEVVVQCIGAIGDSLWRRTLEFEAIPLPTSVVDGIREQQHRIYRREFSPSDVDAALRLPTHWPPVTEGFAGSDGALWLRGAVINDTVTYTVLDRTGALRTTLPVSSGLRILWADSSTVWAEERDDDDLPTLARFSIVMTDSR